MWIGASPRNGRFGATSPQALAGIHFADGSMGPKVEAACRFAALTGKPAAIGALPDLVRIVAGEAGTTVYPKGATEYGTGEQVRKDAA